MQVIITAVGPDNRGLVDPIIHHVAGLGANICEIQMYDRDSEHLFAMLLRIDLDIVPENLESVRQSLQQIGTEKGLTIRVWSRDESAAPPRLALCTTYRPEPARAVLESIRAGNLQAEPVLLTGNRHNCSKLGDEFGVPWRSIGNSKGEPDNQKLVELLDEFSVDYVVLARYMRILPARTCWEFAGGRIINLHHGLLPSFPGFRPYEDAYSHRMLTYGATVHFIVPELDAGNQIIHQSTFAVPPGTTLDEIKQQGETEHEPHCLVEGLRRVIDREVELHFHRVVRIS
ncbi:MAG TPA: formyltransferase family protein [Planctomycetaceae bacterium]|nr:formyltransferase family protein [Planctomycetaceae bacterium]